MIRWDWLKEGWDNWLDFSNEGSIKSMFHSPLSQCLPTSLFLLLLMLSLLLQRLLCRIPQKKVFRAI